MRIIDDAASGPYMLCSLVFGGRLLGAWAFAYRMDHHNPSYAQRIEGEVTAFQNQICVIRMHPKKKGCLVLQ